MLSTAGNPQPPTAAPSSRDVPIAALLRRTGGRDQDGTRIDAKSASRSDADAAHSESRVWKYSA